MTAATSHWQGLQLDPLDVLFFRDGRPFDAATRVSGGLPNPQTLAGALRTTLLARTGFDFAALSRNVRAAVPLAEALRRDQPAAGRQEWIFTARFRGPWLALARTHCPVEPLLPVPATLVRAESGGWLRSEPWDREALPGWKDKRGLLPLWRRGKPDTKAQGGFLTLTGLCAFLQKEVIHEREFFTAAELYDFDNRTGIGIDMHTMASAKGEIYGIRLLSFRPRIRDSAACKCDPYHRARVCLYAEILPGEGAPELAAYLRDPVPLGGEGKYVSVSVLPGCRWPAVHPAPTRSLWYLATPAFFGTQSALPELHPGWRCRAAASGAGLAVSGWDVAGNGPRPTRFAVPAGAVYFLEGAATIEEPFVLPDEDRAEGWGFALQGAW